MAILNFGYLKLTGVAWISKKFNEENVALNLQVKISLKTQGFTTSKVILLNF